MSTPVVVRQRVAGVDAARGLAVIGMMAAHVWPRSSEAGELLVDGRPAVLFAVVAGLAIGLMTGGQHPTVDRRGARVRLAVRAGALFALGLILWTLPSGIAIILDYYGLLFLLLIPALFAPRWVIATIAAVLLIVAPLLRELVVAGDGEIVEPGATVLDYLLTGWYPALPWLPLLLVGLLLGRCGVHRHSVRALSLALGATAAVIGYGAGVAIEGVDAGAHSNTTAWLLGAGGLAIATVTVMLIIVDRPSSTNGRLGRLAAVLTAPLIAIGRIALTVYVGHVLVIAIVAPLGPAGQFDAVTGIVMFVALSLAAGGAGMLCQRRGRRGPLETLLAFVADAATRRVHGATMSP